GPTATAEDRFGLGNSLRGLAVSLDGLGRADKAEPEWRRAGEVLEQLVKDTPLPEHRASLARTLTYRANVLKRAGEVAGAEKAQRRALDLLTQLTDASPDEAFLWEQAAQARLNLGALCSAGRPPKEAERHYRAGLECCQHAAKVARGYLTVEGAATRGQLL